MAIPVTPAVIRLLNARTAAGGPVLLDRRQLDAVLADLDGVVTRTARLHAAAWKETFDAFLGRRESATGTPQLPFDPVVDYRRFVDGRPRLEGVEAFLRSRDIALPLGGPGDPPGAPTEHGLAAYKNAAFLQRLAKDGAEVFPHALRLLSALRGRGFRTAVVSSSRNCLAVLRSVGALDLFDARLDGVDAEHLGLPGKPAPDVFLAAAHLLEAPPDRAAVLEDALAGVEAARVGGFRLVLGVDRAGQAVALFAHGATAVAADLDFREEVAP